MLNHQSIRRLTALALLTILLETQVWAGAPRMNLDFKWSRGTRNTIGDFTLADFNGDGKEEVYVGLPNNTVIVLDRYGTKVGDFVIGNASQIGGVYAMEAADLNGDSQDEIIFGLGGAKDVRTYSASDFEIGTTGLTPKDKVLYRVIRNLGGVYVMNHDGTLMWRYLTLDSVRSVSHIESLTDGTLVAAGVGDVVVYIYNEKSDEVIDGEVCYSDEVTDEIAGFTAKQDCTNPAICCFGLKDCNCRWSEKTGDDGQPEEICYRSYTKITCGEGVTGDKVGWRFVEYKEKNGTVILLDPSGRLKGSYGVTKRDEKGKLVVDADNVVRFLASVGPERNNTQQHQGLVVTSNNGDLLLLNVTNPSRMQARWQKEVGGQVRSAWAADINRDGLNEELTGNGEGIIEVFDNAGKVLWKQRVDGAVTDIRVADVETDESMDIIAASTDGNIYVYNPDGSLAWSFPVGDDIYGLEVTDIDGNGLVDFIVRTTRNVTRFETTEFYIKRFLGDTYYNRAYQRFTQGDYTLASIYIDKSLSLYREIDDRDNIPKGKDLRDRIDSEFRVLKKQEADRYYQLALGYYGSNDMETAMRNLKIAREMYGKIEDEEGLKNCEDLEKTIQDEGKNQKILRADGYYSKANSLANWGNYTGALYLIGMARQLYDETGVYDGTVKCDMLVIGIAEKNYRVALSAFQVRDYRKALTYALSAADYYDLAKNYNGTQSSLDLARRANESINNPGNDGRTQGTDLIPYVVGIVIALILAIVLMRIIKPGAGARKMPVDKRLAEADEDLDQLMKDEG